jgi:predicted DsbA family dithiol-disulfide isomerase
MMKMRATKFVDVMNDDCVIIKTILHDGLNDDFDVQIGLRARSYESTDTTFEEFDVPPHLLAYLEPIGSFGYILR